ncbi:MAG TPA: arsenic resistance N-acetyltransferase ArsN2 [Gemmatimonadales bacterium]|nr:arsenic resistance N-acetyltransferase ArsN2 [Gemmatimonadales bacterium]
MQPHSPGPDTVATLRPARPDDLPRARRLLQACELPTGGVEDQFGPQYVVAEVEGDIVGLEGIERYGRYGLLRSAAVRDDWRGRGLGEALTRDRLEWATQEGLEALFLLTTTAGDYFPRFGFRPVERSEVPEEVRRSAEFVGICPASAIAMRLDLGAR